MEEKERLDSVLAILQLSEQPAEQPAPDHAETEVDETEPASSLSPKLKPQVGQSNSAVFKKILQKVPSAPEFPKKTNMALQTPHAKVLVPAMKTTGGSSGSTEGASCRPQLKRQLAFLELDKEEEEMLRWMSTDITVAKTKKHMKRPASKTQGKQKKKAKVEKQEGPDKTKKKEKKPSFAQKVLKSSFRKRKCDAAYHSAKKKALAEGMVLPEACKVASAASSRVAKKIEKGDLTEE